MTNNLSVLPVKDITKESIEDKKIRNRYNELLPRIPFLMLIIAPVRSGKSVLLMNLIYRMYNACFDQIVYISPTVSHDKSTRMLWEDDDIIKVDENLNQIDAIVEGIVDNQKDKHESDRKHVLVVLDDCLGLFSKNGYLMNLCSRFRHYKISIVFTTQAFKSVPPIVRNNATSVMMFKTANDAEKKKIFEEYAGNYPKFDSIYEQATREKFNFLYLDQEKIKAYHNFDTLLYSKDDDYN